MKQALWTKILVLAVLLPVMQVGADMVIIVHPENPLTSISSRDLRDVFLGNRSRVGGTTLVPVLLREGSGHEAFLEAHMGRTAVQFQTHWRTIVFTGRGKPLTTFDSDEEIVAFVSKNIEAVGYVAAGAPRENVRVLSVE